MYIRTNDEVKKEYEASWGQGVDYIMPMRKYGILGYYSRQDYWDDAIEQISKIIQRYNPKNVLDAGSGDGTVINALAIAFPLIQFYGIEQSVAGVTKSNKGLNNVSIQQGDVRNAFNAPHCDLVYSRGVMEQLPRDWKDMMKNMHHAVTADGHVLFIEPFKEVQTWRSRRYIKQQDYFSQSFKVVKDLKLRILRFEQMPLVKDRYRYALLLCKKK